MNEQISKVYELIMMYMPMIITVCSTLLNFLLVLKKLKEINVKEDMSEALTDTDNQLNELIAQTRIIQQENQLLRQKQDRLIEAISKVEQTNDENY